MECELHRNLPIGKPRDGLRWGGFASWRYDGTISRFTRRVRTAMRSSQFLRGHRRSSEESLFCVPIIYIPPLKNFAGL